MITGMKIQVKDLLSFSELSLDLSSTKFYSVIGENGAGKTSFFELISIILYGRYSKGVDKKAIIRYGQDKGYGVEVEGVKVKEVMVGDSGSSARPGGGRSVITDHDKTTHVSFDSADLQNMPEMR